MPPFYNEAAGNPPTAVLTRLKKYGAVILKAAAPESGVEAERFFPPCKILATSYLKIFLISIGV